MGVGGYLVCVRSARSALGFSVATLIPHLKLCLLGTCFLLPLKPSIIEGRRQSHSVAYVPFVLIVP